MSVCLLCSSLSKIPAKCVCVSAGSQAFGNHPCWYCHAPLPTGLLDPRRAHGLYGDRTRFSDVPDVHGHHCCWRSGKISVVHLNISIFLYGMCVGMKFKTSGLCVYVRVSDLEGCRLEAYCSVSGALWPSLCVREAHMDH